MNGPADRPLDLPLGGLLASSEVPGLELRPGAGRPLAPDAPAVVILTALNAEYRAVRALLHDRVVERHATGTVFEVGRFREVGLRVVTAVAGEGTLNAAVVTERAVRHWRPEAVLYVGVAGGLKDDIGLGDVVVGTKIYAPHGGKEQRDAFLARPQAWEASHDLTQIARLVEYGRPWTDLLDEPPETVPAVHFKPIVAGDVVLNSRTSPLARQLHGTYNDAAAIEMESAGSAKAAQMNHGCRTLTVRGISDHADGEKTAADAAGSQPRAAAHAAAFALALVAEMAAIGLGG
ncbi:5'-methylthioadenosine/S-adenosylhomocysteine nucleosidase family protein [Actinomadura roseirufa]|uniref:5'-methylthioadenosine/S-adenosylhomocysteine nucleosidase family protein n=1 Tax=Actinomadura roseirufa TaxID=2094049 RepID=UPI0010418D78|nr:5'-methylthioadenosine/S-adenosylhomocysteine nucleosidase [Actinomadura roseirufa]